MPKTKPKKNANRVCFWFPMPWRVRLLALVGGSDGRKQGEFIRASVCSAIERAEDRLKNK